MAHGDQVGSGLVLVVDGGAHDEGLGVFSDRNFHGQGVGGLKNIQGKTVNSTGCPMLPGTATPSYVTRGLKP